MDLLYCICNLKTKSARTTQWSVLSHIILIFAIMLSHIGLICSALIRQLSFARRLSTVTSIAHRAAFTFIPMLYFIFHIFIGIIYFFCSAPFNCHICCTEPPLSFKLELGDGKVDTNSVTPPVPAPPLSLNPCQPRCNFIPNDLV